MIDVMNVNSNIYLEKPDDKSDPKVGEEFYMIDIGEEDAPWVRLRFKVIVNKIKNGWVKYSVGKGGYTNILETNSFLNCYTRVKDASNS